MSEENKRRLFVRLDQAKQKECDREAPPESNAASVDKTCTDAEIGKMMKAGEVGHEIKRGCLVWYIRT